MKLLAPLSDRAMFPRRSLFAALGLAAVLTHCGTRREHTTAAGHAGGGSGAVELSQGGGGGRVELSFAGAEPETAGACALGSTTEFDSCPSDATDGLPCDGSKPACMLASDAGASGLLLCETMFYPNVWKQAVELTSPCDARALGTCPRENGSGPDAVVREVMTGCLGDESSMTVLFDHGCPAYVVSSAHRPEQTSCVIDELDGKRYPCLGTATCGQAQYSTLP